MTSFAIQSLLIYAAYSLTGNAVMSLPPDAMRKRGLCSRPVSVCQSVCHVGGLYPDSWKHRQTSFSARYIAPSFYFLDQECRYPIPRGAKYTGWDFFNDFRLKSPFIWETVWDWPMVAMEHHSWRMDTSSDDIEWP